MKMYKYTNKINDFNILEAIVIADNLDEARELIKPIVEKNNWGNYDQEEFEVITAKKGVVLESVNTD